MVDVSRMLRTVVFAAGAVVLVEGCGKNTSEVDGAVGPEAVEPAPAAAVGAGARVHPPMGGAAAASWTIEGTVSVTAELAEKAGEGGVLFVMARVPGQRMPVAVARIPEPTFPLEYTLTAGHAMEPGAGVADGLEVVARLSRAGTAGPPQPGDLEGSAPGPVAPGATGVEVLIGTEH